MVSSDDGDHDEKKRVSELIGGTGAGKPPDLPAGVSITPFSRKIFEICMKFFDDILSKIDDPKEFRKVSSNFIKEYSLCVKENFNNILSNDQNYRALKITHSACDTAFRIASFNEVRDLQDKIATLSRRLDITMIYLTIAILVLSIGSVWIAVDEKPIFISILNTSISKEHIAWGVTVAVIIVSAIVIEYRWKWIQKLIQKMKKL